MRLFAVSERTATEATHLTEEQHALFQYQKISLKSSDVLLGKLYVLLAHYLLTLSMLILRIVLFKYSVLC